jgi:hypothetical protein
LWLYGRLLVIASNIVSLQFGTRMKQGNNDMDLVSSIVISAVWSLVLFVWLTVARKSDSVDTEIQPRWTMPFLPPNTFPLQFWHLVGISILCSGLVGFIIGYITHSFNFWSLTFACSGIGLLMTLKFWFYCFRKHAS